MSALPQSNQVERFLDSFARSATRQGRQHAQVGVAGKVFVKRRRFDNRAHSPQRA